LYQRRDFYRHARYVHGWLSAFAFIVLIFFAATGLFLNNPDWFKSKNEEQTTTFTPPTLVSLCKNKRTQVKVLLNMFVQNSL
jgi:hypothetical protein